MGEQAITRELNQYAEVFSYYNLQAEDHNSPPASKLLLRTLYGEQVAPQPHERYQLPEPPPYILETLDLLSQGYEVDAIAKKSSLSVSSIHDRIKDGFAHYDTTLHPLAHCRLTVVKTAIEMGHIAIETKPTNTDLLSQITLRQLTVFHLLEQGLTRQQTARRLFLSLDGVKSQIKQFKENSGAINTTHAARLLREEGIFKLAYHERVPRKILQEAGVIFA